MKNRTPTDRREDNKKTQRESGHLQDMEKDSGVGSWASSPHNCDKMKVLSKHPGFWFEYRK